MACLATTARTARDGGSTQSGWRRSPVGTKGDPVGLLGQLDAAIFRARRLVVDTGMHAKHWTRQQAIDYLGPNPAGSAVAEVERYVMRPGQACSYMIGELKIVELRERAKRELGGKILAPTIPQRRAGHGPSAA